MSQDRATALQPGQQRLHLKKKKKKKLFHLGFFFASIVKEDMNLLFSCHLWFWNQANATLKK